MNTPQYIFEHELIPKYLSEKREIFLDHVENGSKELRKAFITLWEGLQEMPFDKKYKNIKLDFDDFLAKIHVVNEFNCLLIMKMPEPIEVRDCFYVAFNIDSNYLVRYFTLEKSNEGKVIGEWDLDEDSHLFYVSLEEISIDYFIDKISKLVSRKLKPFKGYQKYKKDK